MASRAYRRRHRLFEGPTLFSRTRMEIAEVVGLVWLAVEVSRFVRSKRMKATAL
jgi:hypothetical protein